MLFNASILSLILAARGLAVPVAAGTEHALERRVDHVGIATFYEQNGAAGSCGEHHSDSDKIIALSPSWQGFCGRKIQITNNGGGQDNPGTGNVVIATVKDTCPGCDSNHLDLSHGAFQALTDGHLDPPGQINIIWHFCNVNGQC